MKRILVVGKQHQLTKLKQPCLRRYGFACRTHESGVPAVSSATVSGFETSMVLAMENAIQAKNEKLVKKYYGAMKMSTSFVPDIPCYKSLLLFYAGRSDGLPMVFDVYDHFAKRYGNEGIAGPMQLGPLVFASCLMRDEWVKAEQWFSECMNAVLNYTNELNNKQELNYQDRDDRSEREKQEVAIIERFLKAYMDVLVQKLNQSMVNTQEYISDLLQDGKSGGSEHEYYESYLEYSRLGSFEEAKLIHTAVESLPQYNIECEENEVLKRDYLSNIIHGLSLAADIVARWQLYETEDYKIHLGSATCTSLQRTMNQLNRFLTVNYPVAQGNFQLIKKSDQPIYQDIRLMYQHLVTNKMRYLGDYLMRPNPSDSSVSQIPLVVGEDGLQLDTARVTENALREVVLNYIKTGNLRLSIQIPRAGDQSSTNSLQGTSFEEKILCEDDMW